MSTKACTKCGEQRDASLFQLYKGKPSGQCRMCKTASEKARRARVGIPVKKLSRIEGDKKLCLSCDQMKPLDDFSSTPRGLGGTAAYCKECMATMARARKGAAAKTTAAYRKRHPERHKANHRVRMFEYRTAKKVTADGSVTDSFLKELYAQENCHYCGEKTPEDQRTADHKMPLAKEGTHTAGNLVMACWTCNCSKSDLTEEEFIERVKNDMRS